MLDKENYKKLLEYIAELYKKQEKKKWYNKDFLLIIAMKNT